MTVQGFCRSASSQGTRTPDIRLNAGKSVVNQYLDIEVDRYNALASDYNSRCGQFRYRRGTLEPIRAEVETRRASLEAEGVARFRRL